VSSLDLRFADSKSLIDAISGLQLITFTRASSSTFVGSGGLVETAGANVPRFEHDPATGECLGFLYEGEVRSNLLLHSRTLTNAAWVATNITPAKNQVGADGVGNSASSITATAANGTILQAITSASTARATSAYVRRITGSGAIEMTQNGGATWTAVTVTSSWSRVSIPSATVTNPSVGFRIATSGDAIAVDYVQCENGASSTSVIETTTAVVTRSADVSSITGTNFNLWYSQAEGTIYADAIIPASTVMSILSLDDGTASNRIQLRNSTLTTDLRIVAGGMSQSTLLTANAGTVGGRFKHIGAYRLNDLAVALNGGIVATQSTALLPTASQAVIGTAVGSSSTIAILRRLTVWPRRLPDATLQTLTR
jgi:hypothetical protein